MGPSVTATLVCTLMVPLALPLRDALAEARPLVVAPVCLELDRARDALPEYYRNQALTTLTSDFHQRHLSVADSGCATTINIYHRISTSGIDVHLTGPGSAAQESVPTVDELPSLYHRMVESLVTGAPMAAARVPLPRTEEAEFFHLRPGYAANFGVDGFHAAALGIGYRNEWGPWGLDLSGLNVQVSSVAKDDTSGTSDQGKFNHRISVGWLRVMGLRLARPTSRESPYVGTGLALATTSVLKNGAEYGRTGLQSHTCAGWEFPRQGSIRMFIELNFVLPLYRAHRTSGPAGTADSVYSPSAVLTFGVGWARPHASVH